MKRILVLFGITIVHSITAYAQTSRKMLDDIAVFEQNLRITHPAFKSRDTSIMAFGKEISALKAAYAVLPEEIINIRLMKAAALLKDAHTSVFPTKLNKWYAIRFYQFTDGIYITAADSMHRHMVGAKLNAIGKIPAAEAIKKIAPVVSADNEFWMAERSAIYLSNQPVLKYFGLVANDTLELVIEKNGVSSTILLRSAPTDWGGLGWFQWGEMYGPMRKLYSNFNQLTSEQFRLNLPAAPMHARNRIPWWYHYNGATQTFYMQWNFVSGQWKDTAFQAFTKNMFAFADSVPVQKFIIDYRYNSGGNGGLVPAFIHELIKRDKINRKGILYAVEGRKTYSAASELAYEIRKHTNATTVGEPAGAAFHNYGNPTSSQLPYSKISYTISTVSVIYKDHNLDYEQVDYPAPFSSADYFSGKDPAVAFIESSVEPLVKVFWDKGGEAGVNEYRRLKNSYSRFAWWKPFTENEINNLGYDLMGSNRDQDAIKAFQLNTLEYPLSSNTWDSLGEAYMKAGQKDDAKRSFEQALKVDPLNSSAAANLKKAQQ